MTDMFYHSNDQCDMHRPIIGPNVIQCFRWPHNGNKRTDRQLCKSMSRETCVHP